MAGAFSSHLRTHGPLTSPLEDLHPHLAHLKTRWPTAAHHLHAYTCPSPQPSPNGGGGSRADYSFGRHLDSRGDDDLIVLNIYRKGSTNDGSTPSYGVGNSPLSPLFLLYPAAHPADAPLRQAALGILQAPHASLQQLLGLASPSRLAGSASKKIRTNGFHGGTNGSGRTTTTTTTTSSSSSSHQIPGLDELAVQYVLERRGVAVEPNRYLGIGLEIPLKLDIRTPHELPRDKQVMSRLCLRWSEDFLLMRLDAALDAQRSHRLLQEGVQKKRPLGAISSLFGCATALPDLSDGIGFLVPEKLRHHIPYPNNPHQIHPRGHCYDGQGMRKEGDGGAEAGQQPYAEFLACKIYPHSGVVPLEKVVGRGHKPLVSLFSTSALGTMPSTAVIEDLQGLAISREELRDGAGIDVFFAGPQDPHPGSGGNGCGARYWFLAENSCWTLVMDEVVGDYQWGRSGGPCCGGNGQFPSGGQSSGGGSGGNTMYSTKAERVLGETLGRPTWRETLGRPKRKADELVKVETYVVSLYSVFHGDPVVQLDLVSGQMWIAQGIRVELVDLVVAIACAALNVELAIRAAAAGSADRLRDSSLSTTVVQGLFDKLDRRCF